MFVDERANPAQRIALVAMANELTKGIVGTIVQVTPAPIQFADARPDDSRGRRQNVALDVNKHMTHDPTCGAMQWFHPLASIDEATMGVADAALVHRLGARHQVERPEQALGVLRHVQLLDAAAGQVSAGQARSAGRESSGLFCLRAHSSCPSCLRVFVYQS